MSSKVESKKSGDEDLNCGLLLRDIEEISKALYLHKSPRDAFNSTYDHHRHVATNIGVSESKSNVFIRDSLHKDKKSSIWNWKPIKALTHARNHRFNCCFFLHVHGIEGLPPYFNNLKLCVTWKQKANILQTRPAQVCSGMAEFEETLLHQCTIYVGRTGPHGTAKYDPKLFLLHASVIGAPTLDIGSRWVDLTRLLPLTLDELTGDKSSSGKWTTGIKLTGPAKGAVLNVSFGFSIFDGRSIEPGYFAKVPDIAKEGGLHHLSDYDISRTNQPNNLGSVPLMSRGGSYQQSQSANLKLLDEMFLQQGTELSQSVTLLYQKFDEKKTGDPMEFDFYGHVDSWKPMSNPSPESEYVGGQTRHEFDVTEFGVIEQGLEVSLKDQIKPESGSSQRFDSSVIETIDVAEIFKGEETSFVEYIEWKSKLDIDNCDEYECAADKPEHRDNSTHITELAFEELDSDFINLLTSKPSDLDSLLDRSTYNEHRVYMRSESRCRAQSLRRSLSLDDLVLAESIENDFLNMLSIDQDQEDIVSGSGHDSPIDLLRQCEEDPVAWGSSVLDADLMAEEESCSFNPTGYGKVAFAVDLDVSFPIQYVEKNHRSLDRSLRDKRNAEMLENLETEALMHQWGLTEKAFQYSPRATSGGFGSPVYLPPEEPLHLPPIVEGKGPIVRTKDGGFLRSMNPLLFRNANNGARLIVQVSAPVVLPSAMGSMTLEMLRCWACVGVERMCFQANELMPLEDVTGKTIQQVLAEAESASDASNRCDEQWESDDGESVVEKKTAEYQHSAVLYSCSSAEQIGSDSVSIEDLVPMAITNIESLLVEGLKIQSGMPDQEPPTSIMSHLSGASTSSILGADELIKCSLSLEEWLRLDSGQLHIEESNHENMSKLFAAHGAKPLELGSEELKMDDEMVKLLGRSGGAFSENFRMGLKVQLRDPLRNYEMVGSPMLALVQANRAYLPPQPEMTEREGEEADSEENRKNIYQPMFKVSEVHLAGFNVARHGNKPVWGSSRQHQSGLRWLLSSGMARSKKNLVSNSNIVVRSSSGLVRKAKSEEDVLWSISVPSEGEAATWDERIALNVHVRNPDIVFPI
ncbi:protein PLASTID MOVEMENT IMPAIRED 1-RELATED 1-like [Salvia miltiorrhiza]|uniref:protein PLASTID MOVEMENT IMPAIRED 1-RELATED 1-like n=1 Tax=Salvia miltiorrhiza TaxID=226208 RepID=UPI0025AC30CA|nr:protein PLASTID MOVEMENT IMPAIRED 1-RELATED 1-like [Salvia miltiorrhiza]